MAIGESVQRIASGNIHNEVLEILQARASSARVLDVPSGQVVFARSLEAAGFEAVGVDVEPQENKPDFEFHQADLSDGLPLADGSVDYVMSIEGIEHLEKPFVFVRECHRVCVGGGFLVTTTPNNCAIRWRWMWTGYHNNCKYMLDDNNPSPLHHINMFWFWQLR